MSITNHDTIVALATPLGESGVAIVRLSGAMSLQIACTLSRLKAQSLQSHQAKLVKFLSAEDLLIDEGIILFMKGPRSFTGEDVVELQCHGGMLIVRRLIDACLSMGARMAEPGEFSYRAFTSGRLDLAQAEAIQQLIHAKSELALKAAQTHLAGGLSNIIKGFQKELTLQAAILEAWVDFPEEGLEFATFDQIDSKVQNLQQQMQFLLQTYHDGHLICDGIRLCLLGRPNVGKSSLMNALLKKERSIVTDIAGTTRDVIEESATLCGLNVRLIDTAGVREASERIEQEGIRRTWLKVQEADLVLWILDASEGYTHEDVAISKLIPADKTVLVWNKCDLNHSQLPELGQTRVCHISARCGSGLEALKDMISHTIWHKGPPQGDEVMITSMRHKNALQQAVQSLQAVREGLKERLSAEFVCSDMRYALQALSSIIGTDVTEDIITAVFSTFCLGK